MNVNKRLIWSYNYQEQVPLILIHSQLLRVRDHSDCGFHLFFASFPPPGCDPAFFGPRTVPSLLSQSRCTVTLGCLHHWKSNIWKDILRIYSMSNIWSAPWPPHFDLHWYYFTTENHLTLRHFAILDYGIFWEHFCVCVHRSDQQEEKCFHAEVVTAGAPLRQRMSAAWRTDGGTLMVIWLVRAKLGENVWPCFM